MTALVEKTNKESAKQFDPYKEILKAAKLASSDTSFYQSLLRIIVATFKSPYGAIYVSYNSRVVEYDWHTGPDDPKLWKPIVQQLLTETLEKNDVFARILNPKAGKTKAALLSAPLTGSDDKVIGAITIVLLPIHDEADLVRRLAFFKSLLTLAPIALDLQTRESLEKSAEEDKSYKNYRTISQVGKFATIEELAFAITNNLRMQFNCEQVALGLVSTPYVKILSISGMDTVVTRNPGIVPLISAMEECLDVGKIIYIPQEDWIADKSERFYLTKQWARAVKGDAVAVIPLELDSKIIAILALRRTIDRPFTFDELKNIKQKVQQFVPGLILLKRANRTLLAHIKDKFIEFIDWLRTPGRYKSKILLAAITLLVLGFIFGKVPYKLATSATVVPAYIRCVSSPETAILASVNHISADKVRKGQILCEFDHKLLDEERAKIKAELAVISREIDKYLASNDAVNVRLTSAKKKLAEAKLKLIEAKISRMVIKSPIDGVIISGDLRKQVGTTIEKGTKLFEIAKLDTFTIKLYVPEEEIVNFKVDCTGYFIPYANPGVQIPIKVVRIYPSVTESPTGARTYIVEAETLKPYSWLKPGMEGIAKVTLQKKTLWWIFLHRTLNKLSFKFKT